MCLPSVGAFSNQLSAFSYSREVLRPEVSNTVLVDASPFKEMS